MRAHTLTLTTGSGNAQRFRAIYEPIFNAAATRVHIYISGHVHAAEVMLPVATGSLTPSQPDFHAMTTVFAAMVGFPGDEEARAQAGWKGWGRPRERATEWYS